MATKPRNTSPVRSPWRSDFSTVPAGPRRAARYALQMMARCPTLHARMEDQDFLGALWLLALPLVDPLCLERLEANWRRPDTPGENDDADDVDFLPRGRRRGRHALLPGVPGARMRSYLTRCFVALPKTLLTRLAAADGWLPSHPSVAVLARSAGLDEAETRLLDFVEKTFTTPGFRDFLRESGTDTFRDHYACLSAALDVPIAELQPRLRQSGALQTLQLVQRGSRGCDLEDFLSGEDLLQDILSLEPSSDAELLAAIIEPAAAAECVLDDFPHLAKDASRLNAVVKSAAVRRKTGVNALLYGPPGTGKTQFAQALAEHAGLTAFRVRTADHSGDGLSRKGRLGAYQLTQRLLRARGDCVVIFDEVEDAFGNAESTLLALFGGRPRAGAEKGWMNRVLEDNPVPAIWITNDAASMDAAFLRRFLLPVAFTTPPRSVRRQIAERHLGGIGLPGGVLDDLADDSALMPAQFGAARRLLDLHQDGDPEDVVREGVSASRRLLHGSPAPHRRQPAMAFDVAYLNLAGGIAPGRIAEALARTGRGSLCFYGPPGTGKTEFAQVLADALGRELVVRASSDLVSPYVGQTERNLAQMFAELDTERCVLFLDEIDSLLRDRRQARHSWETTQVNELLQQMERFPGIFIAATNLIEHLDTAAMRRFDFKLHFRPLTTNQRLHLFAREALGDEALVAEIPSPIARKLDGLEMLTPGDFANVARQRALLGETLGPEEFLRRLIVECRWKGAASVAA